MLQALGRHCRRFGADRRGIGAVEFALVLPLLLLIALASVDVVVFMNDSHKLQLAASTMGELVAGNDTGKITQAGLDTVFQSQLVIFPEVMQVAQDRKMWVWDTILSSISGVTFKASSGCAGTGTCTYTPYVAWTSGQGRPCGTPLTPASNSAAPSPATLPQDTFGAGFLIVVDVMFDYKPFLASSVIGNVRIKQSYYVAPRYVPSVAFDASAGSSFAKACTVPS